MWKTYGRLAREAFFKTSILGAETAEFHVWGEDHRLRLVWGLSIQVIMLELAPMRATIARTEPTPHSFD
jgi:hypothetical protein